MRLDDLLERPFRRRRGLDRLRFPSPLPARLGDARVVLRDLSAEGAGVLHQRQVPRNYRCLLVFEWEGKQFEMQCSVTRTSLERERHGPLSLTVYHSGLLFSDPASETEETMQQVIAVRVAMALERQRSNALAVSLESARELPPLEFEDGEGLSSSIDLSSFFIPRDTRPRVFIRCILSDGRWVRQVCVSPEQPADGFTVAADEPEAEIELLCLSYQQANEEGRRMIRTFAHLSVTEPAGIPRNYYSP